MATYKNIKSENEVTIKGLSSVTGTASSGEGKLYFKTDGKPYALWEDGTEIDLSGDNTLSWGDSISGVSGSGISINYGSAQATGNTVGISLGNNFNTNSNNSYKSIELWNPDNAGSGLNTGINITNQSSEYISNLSNAGTGLNIGQIGSGGTALSVFAASDVNSSINGLFNITMNGTQSGASTLTKLNTGASTQDHIAIDITGTRQAISIGNSDQAHSNTTNKLYALSGNLYWNGVDLTSAPSLTVQSLTCTGTTQTIDWNSGEIVNLDVTSATGNVTLTLQNPENGDYVIKVTQGSTARDIIFPIGTVQGNGVSGNTVYGVSNSLQVITIMYDGTGYFVNMDVYV